jgi:hypothetical protein
MVVDLVVVESAAVDSALVKSAAVEWAVMESVWAAVELGSAWVLALVSARPAAAELGPATPEAPSRSMCRDHSSMRLARRPTSSRCISDPCAPCHSPLQAPVLRQRYKRACTR